MRIDRHHVLGFASFVFVFASELVLIDASGPRQVLYVGVAVAAPIVAGVRFGLAQEGSQRARILYGVAVWALLTVTAISIWIAIEPWFRSRPVWDGLVALVVIVGVILSAVTGLLAERDAAKRRHALNLHVVTIAIVGTFFLAKAVDLQMPGTFVFVVVAAMAVSLAVRILLNRRRSPATAP
jgi:hypothetical protein